MGKRVDAAAEALVDGLRSKSIYAVTEDAIARADAVMFSDEAVERAAQALSLRMDDITRVEAIEDVRAVIAALKGAGDE